MAQTAAEKRAAAKEREAAAKDQESTTSDSEPEAPAAEPAPEGTRLIRMHTNVGPHKDGKEYEVPAEVAYAYCPKFATFIDVEGSAPET